MKPRLPDNGHTLVEVMVVLSILIFLVAIVVNLTISTSKNQKYTERLSRATEVNQDLLNGLRYELTSSVALFENNALGAQYLAKLDLDSTAPPLASTTLPTVDGSGIFELEASSGAKTGNAILFSQHAWTTEFQCTSTATYLLDVYRIVHYYMKKEEGGPSPEHAIGLNLVRFVSEPLADGDQIDQITDPTDKAEILQHLNSVTADVTGQTYEQVDLVWRRESDPTVVGNIRQIDTSIWDLSDTPLAPRTSPWVFLRDDGKDKSSLGLLYYRNFSIVSNYGRKSWGAIKFGVEDKTGDGFPHGLEVQITGPSSGRLVLINLTIATTNRNGNRAHSNMRTTVFVRDV